MTDKTNLKALRNEALERVDIQPMSTDTAARLLSVIYWCGENAEITHSTALKADCEYIQRHYSIEGGETPSSESVRLVWKYAKDCEISLKRKNKYPDWAVKMMKERYNITL